MIDERNAVHILQIEIARERLQRLDGFRMVLRNKSDADVVRARLHRDAHPQPGVDRVARQPQVRIHHLVVFLAAHMGEENAHAIHRDFELVGVFEPGHVADDVAQQKGAEFVLAIERKILVNQDAAARSERQSFDVLGLRESSAEPGKPATRVRGRDRRSRGWLTVRDADRYCSSSDGETFRTSAMLSKPLLSSSAGSSEVTSTFRASRSRIAFGVFGAIQPMQTRPARLGPRNGARSSDVLKRRRKTIERRRIRPRHTQRRHGSAVDFAHHFLPHFRAIADVLDIHLVEHQAPRSSAFRCGRLRSIYRAARARRERPKQAAPKERQG